MNKAKPPIIIIVCLLLVSGCRFDLDFGGGGGGCSTIGEKGRVLFDFMQENADLSEESGKAFSTGTVSHLQVESADADKSLPAWRLESSDEEVMTVDDLLEGELYPVGLRWRRAGPVELRVEGKHDGKPIDYVRLRAKTPDGLGAEVYHGHEETAPRGGDILMAPGTAGCRVKLFPYRESGGERVFLYGEYDVNVEGAGEELTVRKLGFEDDFGWIVLTQKYYVVKVAADRESGSVVRFTGPLGLTLLRKVRGASGPGEVTGLSIEVTPSWGEVGHVGDSGALTAVQRVADGELCAGYPVLFESSDPDVVRIDDAVEAQDHVHFTLLSRGTAVVTGYLESDPSIRDTITLRAEEKQE